MSSIHGVFARGCGAAHHAAVTMIWVASAAVACGTWSCEASGAASGTAWELSGSSAVEAPQAAQPKQAATPVTVRSAPSATAEADADPRMVTFAKLDRRMSVDWKDITLQEAFAAIQLETGVDMMVMWVDEDNPTVGLRPDRRISVMATRQGVVDIIEKVLERADTRADGDGSTWQITDTGTLQAGPRERLNRFTRVHAYDIADLLMWYPDWFNPMIMDRMLKKRLANGMSDDRPANARAEDLRRTITQMCEPTAWVDNGGEAATIIFQKDAKAFVVNAPDYVHRAIDGYHPSRPERVIAPERAVTPPAPAKNSPPATNAGN